ncbi:carbohydrate ABC transporter permease [Marinobacterium aestuariivivens]|uniref:Carbohydrate ABC transporter permease n=1 Tax=Marinobacterium aestuariivivens TaxID=1698799 RepID=A0ABW2A5K0_9GAMM
MALLYPVAHSVYTSFFDLRMGGSLESANFSGLDNYRWLLDSPQVWESVAVTLFFAAAVVVLEVILGLGLALLLDRPIRGMSVFRTIFILPMMIAPIVVGLIWKYMYNPQFGILNKMMVGLGLDPILWLSSPDWALWSVIIADIWQWTPFIFILSLAALQSLPSSAMEAAKIDGANGWQTVLYVKIPLMVPVIVVATLLRLIDAFKVLEVIYIMTAGGPGNSTEILSMRIYNEAFVSFELGRAAALSNLLLLLVMLITILMFSYNKMCERRTARIRAAVESE